MSDSSVIESLVSIIREESAVRNLSQDQLSTIIALVVDVASGAEMTNDDLLEIFEHIGGGN